jgi:two-component system, LytTR family, sensor kinase
MLAESFCRLTLIQGHLFGSNGHSFFLICNCRAGPIILATMNPSRTPHLTASQKWQIAINVIVIYLPIRIYINISDFSEVDFLQRTPLWVMEVGVNTLFFFLWISILEWIQQQLFNWFGQGFLIEFKIPTQIATFIIACGLAVLFNIGFRTLWSAAETTLENQFGLTRKQIEISPITQRINHQQKRKINTGLTIMAMLSAFYLAANRRAYRQLEDVQLKTERLEKENFKAQLTALKNQISPHFLFNNLSILSSLVENNPKLSVQFINRLSKVYRYILQQSDYERISLKTELEFVETYTFLLKIRFEDKLRIVIDIPESDQLRYSIVPLTLQLLVENAVKHNRMSDEQPLVVYFQSRGNYLVVVNWIQPRPQNEPSTGLGLQNIINRYKLLTEKPVLVTEKDESFIVKIPFLS